MKHKLGKYYLRSCLKCQARHTVCTIRFGGVARLSLPFLNNHLHPPPFMESVLFYSILKAQVGKVACLRFLIWQDDTISLIHIVPLTERRRWQNRFSFYFAVLLLNYEYANISLSRALSHAWLRLQSQTKVSGNRIEGIIIDDDTTKLWSIKSNTLPHIHPSPFIHFFILFS